jgi:tetratricopeptide (TPR) repeat protein
MLLKNKHILTLLLVLFLAPVATEAQKGKGKISDSELREAEFYFTEGEKYYILEDFAKALVLFQKSLEIDPQNATVYYKIAQVYAHGSDLEKALQNAKKALSLDGNNKYFYILTADIYTQMGNFPKAAEVYEDMVSKIKKTEIYLFELAALYLYQQRYDDAIATYNKIETAYGLSEEIAFQKQKIYLQLNKLDLAIKEGDKLIDAFPEEEGYVLKQAEILIANDQFDEASKYLTKYLNEQPNSSQSRLVLSELKRRKGDLEGALIDLTIAFKNPELGAQNKIQLLAEYRTELPADQLESFAFVLADILIEVHPDVADAHTIYGDLLQQAGKSNLAKLQYSESLKIDQSNFTVWQNILQLHFELNEIDSVIYNSNRALELFPNQGSLYYFNGAAYLQEKKYEEAIFALEQGKKLSSSNLTLLSAYNSMLGDAYNSTKEFAKSDEAFEAALDFDPNNYGILNNYSYYLSLRKANLEKAEKMAFKVIQNNPQNVTFLDTYAWVLYTRGKYKEAKKIMEKAIAIGGVEAIHYEHYGDILYKLGNIDGAVTQWQIAKGLDPKSELIDKKIADRKLYE